MKDEFYTKLGIFSDTLKPDEISSILGINCDKGYLKGDLRGHTIIRERENGWIIYSRVTRDAPLQSHIDDLFKAILTTF